MTIARLQAHQEELEEQEMAQTVVEVVVVQEQLEVLVAELLQVQEEQEVQQ